MVTFITQNQEFTLDPNGVSVEYNARGHPTSAVAEVIERKGTKSTTVAIEYGIADGVARLQGFREPTTIHRGHFRSLPLATRQVERLSCVDQVERPEKTFGEALMEGHRLAIPDE